MSFNTSTVSIGKSTKKSDYDRLLDNTKALKDEAITFNGTKTFAGTIIDKNGLEVQAMQLETAIKEDVSTGITQTAQVTDIDITFSFTPTAVIDCRILVWDTDTSEWNAGQAAVSNLWNQPTGKDITGTDTFPYVYITKAIVGTNKVTLSVATGNSTNGNIYYRITCTAARTA